MKKNLFWLLLFLTPLVMTAQSLTNRIDSLRRASGTPMHDTVRVQLLDNLSGVYTSRNLDSAIWYAREGVRLAEKLNYAKGKLYTQNTLAFALAERDLPESMRLYISALAMALEEKDYNAVAGIYYGMGVLQFYLANYPQAIVLFKKSIRIALENRGKLTAGNTSAMLAFAYASMNQSDSACYYMAASEREWPEGITTAFHAYFKGQTEAGVDPNVGKYYFKEGIARFKNIQDLRGLSLAYHRLSELYLQQNQLDSCIYAARQGLQAAQEVRLLRTILHNSRLLVNAFKQLNQTDSAYKYQNIMVAARDSLFSQEKINQLQSTLLEEEQRTKKLEEEKLRLESRTKIYGLLALATFLLLLAGIFYRNTRQKQKANRQLQVLNEEITQQKEEIETQRDHLEQTLTELKATQQQLIQKEKLASLGELTAGIAHEIQNPLNFVNNLTEVSQELVEELKEEEDKPNPDPALRKELLTDLEESLQKVHHHGKRADSIVKGMLQHSRAGSGEKQPTDLNALADEYLRLAYSGLRAKDQDFTADLRLKLDPNLQPVDIAPQEIGRVLLNLYNNAFYAVQQRAKAGKSGEYQPQIEVTTQAANGKVELRVWDNGTGIPAEILNKIYQPFFTTKPTGQGTGLGLSLSYDIVTKGHGGEMLVASTEGEGTEFRITLGYVTETGAY
ncbi:sensor histidine kinase [Nibrella viscosa]